MKSKYGPVRDVFTFQKLKSQSKAVCKSHYKLYRNRHKLTKLDNNDEAVFKIRRDSKKMMKEQSRIVQVQLKRIKDSTVQKLSMSRKQSRIDLKQEKFPRLLFISISIDLIYQEKFCLKQINKLFLNCQDYQFWDFVSPDHFQTSRSITNLPTRWEP